MAVESKNSQNCDNTPNQSLEYVPVITINKTYMKSVAHITAELDYCNMVHACIEVWPQARPG